MQRKACIKFDISVIVVTVLLFNDAIKQNVYYTIPFDCTVNNKSTI